MKDGAYTGRSKEGNPYEGDFSKAVAYDTYEANSVFVMQEGNFPRLINNYRFGAKRLIDFSSAEAGQRVLDLGSGTGISTLELFVQKKGIFVFGIEMSEGMFDIARYKFHQDDGGRFLSQFEDELLLQYWSDFRKESEQFKDKVKFLQADFQKIKEFPFESVDSAIGNQFMHWTDLSKSFDQLHKLLKKGGEVIWNSASHFYDDAEFPAANFGFRYNDFLAYVLEDVCSKGNLTAADYHSLSKPEYDLGRIRSITEEQGFETEQIATYLHKSDFQVFVQNHVYVFVKNLITSHIDPVELKLKTKEAITRTMSNPDALKDIQHKYDIIPVFRSVKK